MTVNTESIARANESMMLYREQNPFLVEYTLTDDEDNIYECRRRFATKQEAQQFAESVKGTITLTQKQ